jgi:hypothetical protein
MRQFSLTTFESELRAKLGEYTPENGTAQELTDEVIKGLKKEGFWSDDGIKTLTPADLESLGVPPGIARQLTKSQKSQSLRNVGQMTVEELLQVFVLGQTTSAVSRRLRNLVGQAPIIAISPSGEYSAPTTIYVWQNRESLRGRDTLTHEGVVWSLVGVEHEPSKPQRHGPFGKDHLILTNGHDADGLDWNVVPLLMQQIAYAALFETRELQDPGDPAARYDLWEKLSASGAKRYLNTTAPKAVVFVAQNPGSVTLTSHARQKRRQRHPLHH